ncbi:hypothetical protein DICVIV_13624 [Dictyocaulus viviparus]|uniref:G-protein coupled receptors family 1 profile domain-containing protein n=1 Tax=Dictyocaulus viviparus TaxID=29172 RepID=A0A0D8XDC2_DICVI|nr:hypothetical protein DICVIV_13624 [Dictyocaulus viviparus]
MNNSSSELPPYQLKSRFFSPEELFRFHLLMLLLASLSSIDHIVFILAIRRLWGVGARSAYLVLALMALDGFIYSISVTSSSFLSAIGYKLKDFIIVWRIVGGIFISTFFSASLLQLYLALQRIICVFFPVQVNRILCRPVVRVSFLLFLILHISLVGSTLSLHAGYVFVPEYGRYASLKASPYSMTITRAIHATNYFQMSTCVTFYSVLLVAVKFKLKSIRNAKDEVRLTLQVM